MLCDGSQNIIESSDSERFMGRNGYALIRWRGRIENYMTACLMNLHIVPASAKAFGQFDAAEITRKLHA